MLKSASYGIEVHLIQGTLVPRVKLKKQGVSKLMSLPEGTSKILLEAKSLSLEKRGHCRPETPLGRGWWSWIIFMVYCLQRIGGQESGSQTEK